MSSYFLAMLCVVLAFLASISIAQDGSVTTNVTSGQQIAIASYIHPLADSDAWNRLISYDNHKISVLVANILNGPDSTVDTNWKAVIDRAVASPEGKTIIGYVRTGYLGKSSQRFTTRLGSLDLMDWVAQIEQDVDKWYELYGSISGIFFDEGWSDCAFAYIYRHINNWVKRKYPGAFTVLNPGSPMPQCFEDTMDTLLTFENSYDAYMNHYVSNGWQSADSRKIWHIIYDVPEQQIANVTALAKDRGAGLIEITNGVQPNPYNVLPNDNYMKVCMGAVDGGQPGVATPSPAGGDSTVTAPQGLNIKAFDYSSVNINWSLVDNAVAYAVCLDGVKILDLPPTSQVTVGMLKPGTSHNLTVKAISASLAESPESNVVTVTTPVLPNGKPVINFNATVAPDHSNFIADVLVPYAFVRIYIWAQDGANGWPINFSPTNYTRVNYMVEGTILYKYSGTGLTWSWTPIDQAAVTTAGYRYSWQVPIGTSKANTARFIIQTQGYDPAVNVFVPCPVAGDLDGNGRYCG